MPNATPKFLLDMLNGEDSKDARITELERQLAKLTDDFTRQLDTLSSRNYELRMKNAGLERQLAELRSQPTDIVQRLNTALGEAFKDDPANAVRAHAAVLPLLLSQQTAQQVEDARKVMLSALVNCAHSISENCVVLHRDKSKPGNALNQLVTRAMQAGKEKVE